MASSATSTLHRPANTSGRISSVIVMTSIAALITAIYSLAHPVHDFVEYWTAAHLFAAHQNPYSLGEMFRAEKALGFDQSVPIMFLSPPWGLVLIAPLGFVHSYSLACFVWMIVLIVAVGVSSRLLMDVYFGDIRIPEVSDTSFYRGLFAFTFYPVLLCLHYAQTAPFMLLGMAGFLYFQTRGRPWLAGVLLSLTLIKPQLFYLVWLAIFLQSLQRKQWRILAAATVTMFVFSLAALAINPGVFHQYFELSSSIYMQAYASGVMAGIRKLFGGVGTFWIQWLPPILGLGWFVQHWRLSRANWSWADQLPRVLTVSVLSSAYGWLFDQTLLALPVIALAGMAARRAAAIPRKVIVIYSVLNVALMLAMPFPTLNLLPAPLCLMYLLWKETEVRRDESALLQLCP